MFEGANIFPDRHLGQVFSASGTVIQGPSYPFNDLDVPILLILLLPQQS